MRKTIHVTMLLRLIVLLMLATLVSCTAPIVVTTKRAALPAGLERRESLAELLEDLREASAELTQGSDQGLQRYNYLVARVVEHVSQNELKPWRAPIVVTGARETFRLSSRSDVISLDETKQLIPTDVLDRKRELGKMLATVEGVGAPVVVVKHSAGTAGSAKRHEIPVSNATAVIRFRGDEAQLIWYDPWQTEKTVVAGREQTLAADYGAAMQLTLSKTRVDKLGFARLLNPARYDHTARLHFMQPYDPKRIPVLLVHGLDSTPATFSPMYLQLLTDAEICRRYQFWVFSYPSGYPYHYSAVLLRRELDAVQREYPGHQPMVVMGHSMGGIITRLMLTDAGDQIWRKAFRKAPEDTRVYGRSRDLLEQTLIFDSRKEISRAVFFSAPHRGSNLATSFVGRTIARLVKIPATIADVSNLAFSIATVDQAGLMIQAAPNSIGTLAPKNPFVLAVNEIPITPRVEYHSVIGDRGKGDSPESSDGVVSYWSSHVEGARSEKVVPSGHGTHVHPEGIEEARRILHWHLAAPK